MKKGTHQPISNSDLKPSVESRLLQFLLLSYVVAMTVLTIMGFFSVQVLILSVVIAAIFYVLPKLSFRYISTYFSKEPLLNIHLTLNEQELQTLAHKSDITANIEKKLSALYALRTKQTGIPLLERENLSEIQATHFYRVAQQFLNKVRQTMQQANLDAIIDSGVVISDNKLLKRFNEKSQKEIAELFHKHTTYKKENTELKPQTPLLHTQPITDINPINTMYTISQEQDPFHILTKGKSLLTPKQTRIMIKIAINEMVVYNTKDPVSLLETENGDPAITPPSLKKAKRLQTILMGSHKTDSLISLFLETKTPSLLKLQKLCAFLDHTLPNKPFSKLKKVNVKTLQRAIRNLNHSITLAESLCLIEMWDDLQQSHMQPVPATLLEESTIANTVRTTPQSESISFGLDK